MEPQFILNLGCLDKYNLKPKDFFDMLGIDLKKAVPAGKYFNCPKCNRTQQDTHLIYYKYKNFKFGVDHNGRETDYSYKTLNLYLCICGCLYYCGSTPSVISFKAEKIKEKGSQDKK